MSKKTAKILLVATIVLADCAFSYILSFKMKIYEIVLFHAFIAVVFAFIGILVYLTDKIEAGK